MKGSSYFEFDRWDEIFDNLKELEENCVEIGYFEEHTHESSGLAMSDLAAIHEFGSTKNNIPSRPFMTMAGNNMYGDIRIADVIGDAIALGIKPNVAYTKIGKLGQKAIAESIDSQDFIPLKPETVAKKGHDTILVDTKQLRNDSKFKVGKDEGDGE
jgi:hypothetical protein